ncbi:MAG TPA: NUDIX hydrolase [Hyphomicrobium sp.]|nr:NUDIX hydrolase [Hyphomicrobium sp.]
MLTYPARDAVHAITRCTLRASSAYWTYARKAAEAIDVEWREAQRANPKFFNGVVYLVDGLSLTKDALDATLLKSDFKSYLHWRRHGFPWAGVRDGFGSALIRASDGAFLLGRQRAGNVNSGLAYLPGGFIDQRDVSHDGGIDIAASIARELKEETGLTAEDVESLPGFLVTETGAQLSIAKTFQSPLEAEALKARIERHLVADTHSELDRVVIVREACELADLPMPNYARVLLDRLLAWPRASA